MHPAFSVILFTTLSGAGYGLLFWLGLVLLSGGAGLPPRMQLAGLVAGAVLVIAGLLASVAHLGRPERAWRAFSQWRTSWLSREGVAAVFSLAVMAALGAALCTGAGGGTMRVLAILLCLSSLLTVYCTARIYSCLRPVPAWHNRWVLPGYLLLAVASGGVWLWGLLAFGASATLQGLFDLLLPWLVVAAVAVKFAYWRHIDTRAAGITPASLLGLAAGSRVSPFEAPHTEGNFLLKEMGFALARKHGRPLRRLAVLLMALVLPLLMASQLLPPFRLPAAVMAVLAVMSGVLVERWLFFAQARHVVLGYYDAQPT